MKMIDHRNPKFKSLIPSLSCCCCSSPFTGKGHQFSFGSSRWSWRYSRWAWSGSSSCSRCYIWGGKWWGRGGRKSVLPPSPNGPKSNSRYSSPWRWWWHWIHWKSNLLLGLCIHWKWNIALLCCPLLPQIICMPLQPLGGLLHLRLLNLHPPPTGGVNVIQCNGFYVRFFVKLLPPQP